MRVAVWRAVCAASLFGLGCAAAAGGPTGSPAAPAEDSGADGFVRAINPFPVLDEHGRAYDQSFLGGLNVPRPQFIDIDGDGDLDLFLQEHSSALWYFENTGSAREPRWVWRTDRYQYLDIAEWSRFADIDADGDQDLLAELRYSYVKLFRNTGGPTNPVFTLEPDSLRDAQGQAIFADRQNIPALVDLDCNNRLDLFLGRIDGTVARYEAPLPGSERFAFVTERFQGIEIIGQVDTIGSRHGANTMSFADGDGDGDLDLYWGDYFEPGVLLIENIGASCRTPALGTIPILVPGAEEVETSGFNVPALPDIDGDGDLDFLIGVLGGAFNPIRTSVDNFLFWERVESGDLELRTKRYLYGIDIGAESAPAFADIDGDEDLDLLVGGKIDAVRTETSRLWVFRNEGSRTAPSFRLADTLDLATVYHYAPAPGDLDADGDLDLLLGTWNQDVLFFRNEGTAREPRWVRDSTVVVPIGRASNTMPALVDIDGDGDLDVYVGEASGELNFVRNDGTPQAPRFVLAGERVDSIDVGRRAAPAFIDLDGDGLQDLVLGREDAGAVAYRNAGTRTEPRFVPMQEFELPLHPLSAAAFADLDGDGRPEVIAGTAGGGLLFFSGGR